MIVTGSVRSVSCTITLADRGLNPPSLRLLSIHLAILVLQVVVVGGRTQDYQAAEIASDILDAVPGFLRPQAKDDWRKAHCATSLPASILQHATTMEEANVLLANVNPPAEVREAADQYGWGVG